MNKFEKVLRNARLDYLQDLLNDLKKRKGTERETGVKYIPRLAHEIMKEKAILATN